MQVLVVQHGVVDVSLVDDPQMIELHDASLGLACPTDVLTYDLRVSPNDAIQGDLVVCVDEAARQAHDRRHPVRLELLLYMIHGVLHLIGYDDHDEHEARMMHTREDEVLQAIGCAPAYHVDATEAAR